MIKVTKFFEIWRMYSWEGFKYVPYMYSGHDGRRVIDWILHIGIFRLVHYRLGF